LFKKDFGLILFALLQQDGTQELRVRPRPWDQP
jgi:hypothetical protein